MKQADALMDRLQHGLLEAGQRKSALDSLAARRKLQLLVVMTLGSTLLLAANLMSEKPAATAEAPETDAEAKAAERLVELAMKEAKTLAPDASGQAGDALKTSG
jgi:hypothetical protein